VATGSVANHGVTVNNIPILIWQSQVIIFFSEGRLGLPTYDYRCTKCGHQFAVEQSMRDKPLKRCPKCGGALDKLLPQSINLIFKGSGFYVTDYKRKGQGPPKSGTDSGRARSGKPAKAGEGDK